jgi:hypothetical protein
VSVRQFVLGPVTSMRLDPEQSTSLEAITGTQEVKLTLTMHDNVSVQRANRIHPSRAVLEIFMSRDRALEIYRLIRSQAKRSGWVLPED